MGIRIALPFVGMFELAIIVGVVLLVVSLTRRKDREYVTIPRPGEGGSREPRRPEPPPLPPGRMKSRPTVSGAQLAFAIVFLPFVIAFWALASLGDLVAIPVHAIVGTVTGCVALLFSLVGAQPTRLWRVSGRQFARAGGAAWSTFVRLVSAFGLGGIIDRVKEDARDADEPDWAKRAAEMRGPGSGIAPRTYPFEDRYRIESSLGGGGSTARLFVVRRVANHRPVGDRLVLKYFDMGLGSRLEEVIRESRGMLVAKEMGIVLDHHLDRDHFWYVMPYYEGETLTRAAARIHRLLPAKEEMGAEDVRTCLEWTAELLRILDGYHRHGVIHKDVKPDNVIVTEDGIRLVDLGLLTPLTSAMTLTTHGTEYFRDPEMVKLAVQGKRVRDVEAVRFDVYSAGALLYYLLEGSFPACGPLSRFSRPVPMPLSVIVSQAMAEGTKRYPSVAAMRTDLDAAIAALGEGRLESLPVSRLPSLSGESPAATRAPAAPPPVVPAPAPAPKSKACRGRRLRRVVVAGTRAVLLTIFLIRFLGPERPFASTDGSATPRVVEASAFTALTGESAATAVEGWLHELELLYEHLGGGPRTHSVPVLIVADESLALDRIVGDLQVALSVRQIPFHPSSSLAGKVRAILAREEGNQPAIDEGIRAAAAPDEPPAVLYLADHG